LNSYYARVISYLHQGGYVFISACLLCYLAGLRNNYSTIFKKFGGQVRGTWATEETVKFGGNPHHVALGLLLGFYG